MLAARLKADPNDALGWVRLIRAYTVLGEKEKALQALADARKAFADNKDAQTAFTTAAKALKHSVRHLALGIETIAPATRSSVPAGPMRRP